MQINAVYTDIVIKCRCTYIVYIDWTGVVKTMQQQDDDHQSIISLIYI